MVKNTQRNIKLSSFLVVKHLDALKSQHKNGLVGTDVDRTGTTVLIQKFFHTFFLRCLPNFLFFIINSPHPPDPLSVNADYVPYLIASESVGARIRVVQNPGPSPTTITTFPWRRPTSTAAYTNKGQLCGTTGTYCTIKIATTFCFFFNAKKNLTQAKEDNGRI